MERYFWLNASYVLQKLQTFVYLHMFTDCFMKISLFFVVFYNCQQTLNKLFNMLNTRSYPTTSMLLDFFLNCKQHSVELLADWKWHALCKLSSSISLMQSVVVKLDIKVIGHWVQTVVKSNLVKCDADSIGVCIKSILKLNVCFIGQCMQTYMNPVLQRITICPHGYHHNGFMETPALGTQEVRPVLYSFTVN